MKHVRNIAQTAALLASLANGQAMYPVASAIPSAPMVDLGYVKYQGVTNETAGIEYFRGLPYAANPTGPLRWQKPRPIESNNNFDGSKIYNATKIAPACPASQPLSIYNSSDASFGATPYGVSEDCLILDVLRPSHPVSTSLPVMVQIHGGGYTIGEATSYAGDAMVNASDGNMLYVSMQYRLGIYGFLAGSEVAQDGVLNAGLLDQRAALDWIQRNIRAFGGDPSRVTIWGGSAGGGSVTCQLIAGGAYDEPPFSAAIPEYPWWQPFLNASEQDIQYNNALKLSNCSSVSCLRSLPATELTLLSQQVLNDSYPAPGYGFGVFYFGPVVDGKFIQELPSEAFDRGHFYDVPIMLDREAYEGDIFSNTTQMSQIDETTDAEYLFPFAGPAFFSRLYQLYPRSDFNSTFFQRQTWFGDWIINCPTYYMATHAVDRNSNSSAVFKLIWAAGAEVHGSTTAFLASNITGFPAANNHTLAEIMSSYWISFAVTHDPNPMRIAGAPYWPSYVSSGNGTDANGESVGFDVLSVTYTTVSAAPDPDVGAKCDFWGARPYEAQN